MTYDIEGARVPLEEREPRLVDFLDEFFEAFTQQIESDEKRWGTTWLNRPMEGQEERTFQRFQDYFDQFEHASQSIPWLKVVGEAFICWVRETHPEVRLENR